MRLIAIIVVFLSLGLTDRANASTYLVDLNQFPYTGTQINPGCYCSSFFERSFVIPVSQYAPGDVLNFGYLTLFSDQFVTPDDPQHIVDFLIGTGPQVLFNTSSPTSPFFPPLFSFAFCNPTDGV